MNDITTATDLATTASLLPLTGTYSPTKLIDSLSSLPPSWWVTPVKEDKRAFVKGWQDTSNPDTREDENSLKDYIRKGKAKGIGLITGKPTNLIAIDLDGFSAERLVESISGLSIDEALPTTVSFSSGTPGRRQMLYQIPDGALTNPDFTREVVTEHNTIKAESKEQLEFRFNGHQSVLPPSAHPKTGCYHWINPPTTDGSNMTNAPNWVIRFLNSLSEPQQNNPVEIDTEPDTDLDPDFVEESLEKILKGAAKRVANSKEKGRMNTLNKAAWWCGRFAHYGLSIEQVEEALFEAASSVGLVADEKETRVKDAINRGFQSGTKKPKALEEPKESGDDDKEEHKSGNFILSEIVKECYSQGLRFNTLSNEIELNGKPLKDSAPLFVEITTKYPSFHVNQSTLETYLKHYSQLQEYSPVQEWLEGLSWDGIPRFQILAEHCLGTTKPLHLKYLHHCLVGAVARTFEPGCQMDNVLILNGGQGIGKTSFVRKLAGDWYASLSGDLSDKDSIMRVQGAFILECGELDFIQRKAQNPVKEFITRTTDKFRMPYAKLETIHPRRCIFIGTTNEQQSLTDNTGSRRFWVIKLEQKIDLQWLESNRTQLWAEAVWCYQQGHQWWLNELEERQQAEENKQFEATDPWDTLALLSASQACAKKRGSTKAGDSFVTASEVLEEMGFSPTNQQSKDVSRMGKVLKRLGFIEGKRTRKQRAVPWKFPLGTFKNPDSLMRNICKSEFEDGDEFELDPEPTSEPSEQSKVQRTITATKPYQPAENPHPEAEAIPDTEEITRLKAEKLRDDGSNQT